MNSSNSRDHGYSSVKMGDVRKVRYEAQQVYARAYDFTLFFSG